MDPDIFVLTLLLFLALILTKRRCSYLQSVDHIGVIIYE
jgi:hypothetical protein